MNCSASVSPVPKVERPSRDQNWARIFKSGLALLDELSGEFDHDDVEIPVSLEYQPAFARAAGLSLVIEDRLDELFLIGLRLSFGEDRTLVERHRSEGFRRVRF